MVLTLTRLISGHKDAGLLVSRTLEEASDFIVPEILVEKRNDPSCDTQRHWPDM